MSLIRIHTEDISSVTRRTGYIAEAASRSVRLVKQAQIELAQNNALSALNTNGLLTDLSQIEKIITHQEELLTEYQGILSDVESTLGTADNLEQTGACLQIFDSGWFSSSFYGTAFWLGGFSTLFEHLFGNPSYKDHSYSAEFAKEIVSSSTAAAEDVMIASEIKAVEEIEKSRRDEYEKTIAEFDVEHRSRYQRNGETTYCNFYVQDVVDARGCKFVKQRANDTTIWLESEAGAQAGWVNCSGAEAQDMADKGYTVVAASKAVDIVPYNGVGHVAMVVPRREGDTGIKISQAGWNNYAYTSVENGFGSASTVHYFVYKG